MFLVKTLQYQKPDDLGRFEIRVNCAVDELKKLKLLGNRHWDLMVKT